MDKTLRNGLSMNGSLNHKWLNFAIESGLALHQFQKNAVKIVYQFFLQTVSEIVPKIAFKIVQK